MSKKRKRKEYLFFDKRMAGWISSMFMPLKKVVKSRKFKRGY